MTRVQSRLRRRVGSHLPETGASLILALAMVTLISVALVAALGFATASLHTVSVIGTQRATAYSADGAMQTALQTLRNNATTGTTAIGTACPTVTYPATGGQPAATVTCQVVAARGKGVPGVNMPPYAIWALGTSSSEPGLYASPSLKVNGPIASNSPANGGGGQDSVQVGALDVAGYTLDARGTCSGTITVRDPADKRCESGASLPDPAYVAQAAPALTSPNPAPTCAVANGVLQFSPGYYTNTAEFETPAYGSCQPGYLYFKTGVYYFDFGFDAAFPDQDWNVPAGQVVVGGELKGWNPATAGSFPGAPGGGTSVGCKTEADGATTGVQFIFGGASQMSVATAGAKVELCADPTPVGTSQQIAVYGQKAGSNPSPTTITRVPTGPASASGWTNLQNTRLISPSTTPIDGQIASYNVAPGGTNTLTLTGYPATPIPAGATNVTYTLEIAHQETGAAGSVSGLVASIGACVLNPTAHVTAGVTGPTTDSFTLNAACIAAVTSAFNVTYRVTATSGQTFTENLDGVDLVVTWTPPAPHPESGCITVIGAGGCSLLNLGTNGAQAVIWGTVYAPLATVSVDDSAASVVELRRGIVARSASIVNVPAGDSTANVCLGGGSPCTGPVRVLRLTATVNGTARLRVLVHVTDAPGLGAVLDVLSWNVLR